ncbi:hypothetical protein [Dactylosporangium sp. CA-233914]|uniref:hypothetical protein n=1 Tax=Dactylosporangium sp. CA-233914 TaxID=3239934 RepID=UPI003D8D8906
MAMHLRRVGDNEVQTPIRRYAHPGSGREIAVIGSLHAGQEAYFARLRERIDALSGARAVVHVEGSGRVDGEHIGAAPQERTVLAIMDQAAALNRRRIVELGWAYQVDALGYPSHWELHDLSGVEVLRRIGVPAMGRFAARQLRAVDWPDTDTSRIERFRARMAIGLHLAAASKNNKVRTSSRSLVYRVMVHERTAYALESALAADQDVVLIWGPMHLPGFAAGLAAHGFAEVGEPEWHTALQLPSFSASLWRLAAGPLRRSRTRRASVATASKEPR